MFFEKANPGTRVGRMCIGIMLAVVLLGACAPARTAQTPATPKPATPAAPAATVAHTAVPPTATPSTAAKRAATPAVEPAAKPAAELAEASTEELTDEPSAEPTAEAEAEATGSSKTVSADECLNCHGPFEKLSGQEPFYTTVADETINPHVYVPHDSSETVGCTECHEPHPASVKSAEDVAQADVTYCYSCHHQEDFTPCDECHD